MKKVTLILISLMTFLAVACKKETTTTFADEIKDYYIAINNAVGNGFGLIYFEKVGSLLQVNYKDLESNVSLTNDNDNFKVSGDSSISIKVSFNKTINLRFKRNSSNQIVLNSCSTTIKLGVNFAAEFNYAEMFKQSEAPAFYVASKNIRYNPRTGGNWTSYYFSNSFGSPNLAISNFSNGYDYLITSLYGNMGFTSNAASAFGVSVPTWKGNNKVSILVQTKDEAGVDFRNLHDVGTLQP